MADTSIEWAEKVWNPLVGCRLASAGCQNCYAQRAAASVVRRMRAQGHTSPYEQVVRLDEAGNPRPLWNGRVVTVPEKLAEPLRWRQPATVFVNSMSDAFHKDVPDEFIAALFGVMAACPHHTFILLTKRAERMFRWFDWAAAYAPDDGGTGPFRAMWEALSHSSTGFPRWFEDAFDAGNCNLGETWPLPNVWLCVSVEDQPTADERIPWLLDTPAAVRGVSYEPALAAVDFRRLTIVPEREPYRPGVHYDALTGDVAGPDEVGHPHLDWVVVGGESGPGARPFDVAWAEKTVADCGAVGVPVFVKQLGARPFRSPQHDGATGYDLKLRDRKGGDPSEWPEALRVRQWPKGTGRG